MRLEIVFSIFIFMMLLAVPLCVVVHSADQIVSKENIQDTSELNNQFSGVLISKDLSGRDHAFIGSIGHEVVIGNSANIHQNNEIFIFSKNFTPRTGSIWTPFRFEVQFNDQIYNITQSQIELQVKDYYNNTLEIQKFAQYNESNHRAIFENMQFTSPGKKKYRVFFGDYVSEEYDGPIILPFEITIDPPEGCNLDSYRYIINRLPGLFNNTFDIFIDLKYPDMSEWKCFGKGEWYPNNITFYIPNMNFSNPCLCNIEYRFRAGYNIIGPLKGPYIFTNFRSLNPINDDTVQAEVRSDRCGEQITLHADSDSAVALYNNCDDWETLYWNIDWKGKNISVSNGDLFDT